MVEFEALAITRASTAAAALFCILLTLWRAPRTPVTTYFAMFAGAMMCAALEFIYGAALGPLAGLAAIGAAAGCGWFWLFARALFQAQPRYEAWPLVLVAVIIAPEALSQTVAAVAPAVGAAESYNAVMHVMKNAQSLTGSTVLVLVLAEAARGYGRSMPLPERRFRAAFIAAYLAMAAIAVLWVPRAAEGSLAAEWGDAIRSFCMLAALATAGISARYRLSFPTPVPARTATSAPRASKRKAAPVLDAETAALAARVTALFDREELYKDPALKVADLARALGEPEYKVSRCIAGATGFANFNRLVNFHRIERAKRMLSDPSFDRQSILVIGMDCGFGSIGPFNRAFKEATGATPRSWRASRTAQGETSDDARRDRGADFARSENDNAAHAVSR